MLADELVLVDGTSPLWNAVRPLLDVALQLEQQDNSYSWHGWRKEFMTKFLKALPPHCSLMVGVWQVDPTVANVQEQLSLGCICEVVTGEVHSVRTFAALVDAGLPPVEQLEPGYIHAQELMRVAREQVAPVAWALFTDKISWDEWLLTNGDNEPMLDKKDLLASLTQQGRCVLLGSQVAQRHHH